MICVSKLVWWCRVVQLQNTQLQKEAMRYVGYDCIHVLSAIFVAEVERAPYLLLAPWANLAKVRFLGGGSGPPM